LLFAEEIGAADWHAYARDCRQTSLPQSWAYGAAKEIAEGWHAVRLLFRDDTRHPVALIQVLTKPVPLLGAAARMNRGPMLIGEVENADREARTLEVIAVFLDECRRRRWWLLQIAPELLVSQSADRALRALRFRKAPAEPWASGRADIARDDEQLMAMFASKWRNSLRKGIKLGVSVTPFDGAAPELEALLTRYRALQTSRGFSGLSDELIAAMAGRRDPGWRFTLFAAGTDDQHDVTDAVGLLVSVVHGDTATYLIGATTDVGRTLQANYVLLLSAMQHARAAGCRWFDIGGLNASTPDGIAHFKKGINAQPYELIGEWRRVVLPFGIW
jgi:lipid II:glycine glycyltransferase (peptidoglycan interpeptide bridge formation enzyme)